MFLSRCLAAVLASLSILGTLDATASSIRVVALNLEWFPGLSPYAKEADKTQHLEAARPVLEALHPDLFIGTEICEGDALREALSDNTNLVMHVISNFSSTNDSPIRRNQQIALASTLPALAGWAEPWEQTMANLHRGFSFCALENPDSGRLILVYGLHLKSNRSGNPEEEQVNYDMRDASIDQLISHMKRMEQQFADRGIDGWIVGGDFNTNHDGVFGDTVIKRLEQAGFWNTWINTPPEQRHTWKGHNQFPAGTLDYIMVKGLGQPEAHVVAIDPSVSDHNAVVLEVQLPARTETDAVESTSDQTSPSQP